MQYFLDTEFLEDGSTIEPISIGICAEDGREFYVEFDFDEDRVNSSNWLSVNVLPHLTWPKSDRLDRYAARGILLEFIGDDPEPEFWAWYASYDWILLCQLFGRMIHLPKHFPKFVRDLKQVCAEHSISRRELPPDLGTSHHALSDARWLKLSFEKVQEIRKRRTEPMCLKIESEREERVRLERMINNPHIDDFIEAIRLESVHQRERWGNDHDAGKDAPDWYWLIGYLSGKAVQAWKSDDIDKYKHHIITTAAACMNWHANISRLDEGISENRFDARRSANMTSTCQADASVSETSSQTRAGVLHPGTGHPTRSRPHQAPRRGSSASDAGIWVGCKFAAEMLKASSDEICHESSLCGEDASIILYRFLILINKLGRAHPDVRNRLDEYLDYPELHNMLESALQLKRMVPVDEARGVARRWIVENYSRDDQFHVALTDSDYDVLFSWVAHEILLAARSLPHWPPRLRAARRAGAARRRPSRIHPSGAISRWATLDERGRDNVADRVGARLRIPKTEALALCDAVSSPQE